MKKGYGRVADNGLTLALAEQERRLASAGASMDFMDEGPRKRSPPYYPHLHEAIQALGSGDSLVIADVSSLGTTPSDVVDAVLAVVKRGATVFDVGLGREVPWHPAAHEMVVYAQSAEKKRRRRTGEMLRDARSSSERAGGRSPFFSAEDKCRAKPLWRDMELSVSEIMERLNGEGISVSRRTLFRHLGPRSSSGKEA